MNQHGAALGTEPKELGAHVQLGPVAGPLGKYPMEAAMRKASHRILI